MTDFRALCAELADAFEQHVDDVIDANCGWMDLKTEKLLTRARAAHRPKPPSLKEQALLQLDTLNADLAMHGRGCDLSQIRRALEALDD